MGRVQLLLAMGSSREPCFAHLPPGLPARRDWATLRPRAAGRAASCWRRLRIDGHARGGRHQPRAGAAISTSISTNGWTSPNFARWRASTSPATTCRDVDAQLPPSPTGPSHCAACRCSPLPRAAAWLRLAHYLGRSPPRQRRAISVPAVAGRRRAGPRSARRPRARPRRARASSGPAALGPTQEAGSPPIRSRVADALPACDPNWKLRDCCVGPADGRVARAVRVRRAYPRAGRRRGAPGPGWRAGASPRGPTARRLPARTGP